MTLYIGEVDIDHRVTQKKFDVFDVVKRDTSKVENRPS